MIDIDGAIDLHVHSAPDVYMRSVDDVEVVERAAAAGMRGVLLKSHHVPTPDRATVAARASGADVLVLGGLVLNRTVGGLNPVAVETAIELGAREVWMPTIHASWCMAHAEVEFVQAEVRRGREGIAVLGPDGRITAEARVVMEILRDADVVLGTGHLGPPETLELLREAKDMGLSKVLVTHPLMSFTRFARSQMRLAVELGGRLELCRLSCAGGWHDPVPVSRVAETVRDVGPAHCVLATDGGQSWNPPPADMLRAFAQELWDEGLEERDLRTMLCDNPAELLGVAGAPDGGAGP